ncbi:MAG TPA: threonine synthase [Caulobacteraceae bacterium]|nr:threonine synthase [Caulobacteraceae bacterium]
MRYVSTRGEAAEVGFDEAMLAGLAPDGGLYVPRDWPVLAKEEIAAFAGRPYAEVAAAILARFAGQAIDRAQLEDLCADAYAGFSHAAVAPLRQLAPGRFLLELFHGPSLAFKDMAMQLLARLYEHVLARAGRTLTIVCATSGDTGGAAVEALRGRANIRLVVLFPEGRISETQRRFMTTAAEPNVACLAVAGTFDDCQAMLKAMFQDAQFAQAVALSGVNSINWARIAAQCVYFVTSAVALGAPHRPVAFAVPTGNFGSAYAGFVAQRLGLPVERIVTAVNANDIVARALMHGRYARGEVTRTRSPAMDIQVASNFERYYFEACGRDATETARAFRAFARQGAIDIPPRALAAMRVLMRGQSVSEAQTQRTMRATLNETGELIEPHTAVGLAAALAAGPAEAGTPMVVLGAAHPAKFPEAVSEATGIAPPLPAAAARLFSLPERSDRIAADVEAAKSFVREFALA